MFLPIGHWGFGGRLCIENGDPSFTARRTSRSVNLAGFFASSHPPPFPGCDETIPTLRSVPSRRLTTTGFVFTLPAMYSDVSASPGVEARSVRICSATVNRVLGFICNNNRYESRQGQVMWSRSFPYGANWAPEKTGSALCLASTTLSPGISNCRSLALPRVMMKRLGMA